MRTAQGHRLHSRLAERQAGGELGAQAVGFYNETEGSSLRQELPRRPPLDAEQVGWGGLLSHAYGGLT